MRLRNLRIAWTVLWGVVAVLLIVLWVRSYWHSDRLGLGRPNYSLTSDLGDLRLFHDVRSSGPKGWHRGGYEQAPSTTQSVANRPWISSRFYWRRLSYQYTIQIPHWLPVYIAGIVAVVPYVNLLRPRFSLRTLLIITTLIAVVLGLIVGAVAFTKRA